MVLHQWKVVSNKIQGKRV